MVSYAELRSRSFRKIQQEGIAAFLLSTTRHILSLLLSTLRYAINIRSRLQHREILKLKLPRERFEQIYKKNYWSSKESLSGIGSELNHTSNLRNELPKLIERYKIKSIVDAPCGDFNWMKYVLPEITVRYSGFDIVRSVIDENCRVFGKDDIEFRVADICEDQLPDCDLLIVRDCLFHLSFHDIERFLQNISRTNYRYLLTTTHTINIKDKHYNKDIITGDFRLIDIFEHPFCFVRENTLMDINDFAEGFLARKMVLLRKPDVPLNLSQQINSNQPSI